MPKTCDPRELQKIRCFLLDMDGTVSLGEDALPGSADFFAALAGSGQDFIFLTNNSSHSADYYVRRMARLGFPVTRERMLTSTDALALYLQRNGPSGRPVRLYPVGTPDFENELTAAGFDLVRERDAKIDFVAVGFDTTLTYAKLDIACDYIRSGVPWVAANPDRVCPLAGGRVMPDCGAITACLVTCTDRQPLCVIGKPESAMVDMVLASRGYSRQELAMVGDRIYTDLALARNTGIIGIAVLSGEATLAEIEESGIEPDYIFDGIGDLAPWLG
jgi:HAD superfamily hydrolase (TIGR01450 family)